MPGYTGGDFCAAYFSMREFPDRKKEAILTIVMDRLIGMLALVVAAVVNDRAPLAMVTANPSSLLLALDPSLHVGWFYRHNRRIFFSERLEAGPTVYRGTPHFESD